MLPLLAILALAFGLRAFAWHRAAMMMNDGPNFLWQAERILDGDWVAALSHPFHPLYGAVTAAVSSATGGDVLTAAIAVSIASGLVVCVASWGLARLAFPDLKGAAPAAALVAACTTRSINVSADIQADGLFVALVACAAWALHAAVLSRGSRWRMALAGLLTGLAYLTRAEGLALCLVPALWFALGGPLREAGRRCGDGLVFALTLALALAPYAVALHEITGEWCLSLKPSLSNVGLGPSQGAWQAPPDSPMGWPLVPSTHQALRRPDDPPPSSGVRHGALTPGWLDALLAATQAAPPAADPVQAAPTPAQDAAQAPTQTRAQAQEQEHEPPDPAPTGDATDDGAVATPRPADRVHRVEPPPPPRRPDLLEGLHESSYQLVSAMRLETVLLVLPGLVLLLRRCWRTGLAALAMLAVWLAITSVQVSRNHFLVHRHMIVPVTLMLPVAGAGFAWFWSRGTALRTLAVLALVVGVVNGTREQRASSLPRLDALTWVAEHTLPGRTVVSHRQRDGWYARRRVITAQLPVYENLLKKRMQEYDAAYAVFGLDDVQLHLAHWLEQGLLAEVARFGDGEDTVVVLEPHFAPR